MINEFGRKTLPTEIQLSHIVVWMNEWRGPRGVDEESSVPKFEETTDINESDICVKFDCTYNI